MGTNDKGQDKAQGNAPVPAKVNPFTEAFGNVRFSRPTGENKPITYSDKTTIQHRMALVSLEMGKGTGHYMGGFSIVALDRPGADNLDFQLKGPSVSAGPARKPLIVVDEDGKLSAWKEFGDGLIEKFFQWNEKLAEPAGQPATPAMVAARTKFNIPARATS